MPAPFLKNGADFVIFVAPPASGRRRENDKVELSETVTGLFGRHVG